MSVRWSRGLLVCIFCTQLLWLLPVSEFIHESHFQLSSKLRQSQYWNHKVNSELHKLWRSLDVYGMQNETAYSFDVSDLKELLQNRQYKHMAHASLRGLYELYPHESHRVFYHGVGDAWAFWVLIIMQCSQTCAALPYDLEAVSFRNTLAWRGLSGSDDVLWAVLALVQHESWQDRPYQWNGARGCQQLYTEVSEHYVTREGNMTALYWDTNRKYTATISISLWIAASAMMYEKFRDQTYLFNALSALSYVRRTNSPAGSLQPLLSDDGHVFDGRFEGGYVNRNEWSYNAGVMLAALTALFRTTQQIDHLDLAERVAIQAMDTFWNQRPLHETVSFAPSHTDAFAFKGLFLHYLLDFVRVYKGSVRGRPKPLWMDVLHRRSVELAAFVVNKRSGARGVCVYWGEDMAEPYCNLPASWAPQGIASASQLFLLCDFLENYDD